MTTDETTESVRQSVHGTLSNIFFGQDLVCGHLFKFLKWLLELLSAPPVGII